MGLKTEIDVCEIIAGMVERIESLEHKLDMTQQQLNILQDGFYSHKGRTHAEPDLR